MDPSSMGPAADDADIIEMLGDIRDRLPAIANAIDRLATELRSSERRYCDLADRILILLLSRTDIQPLAELIQGPEYHSGLMDASYHIAEAMLLANPHLSYTPPH
jgi:hypothetical protein